jgi:HD-like signal output (HDOD) protein
VAELPWASFAVRPKVFRNAVDQEGVTTAQQDNRTDVSFEFIRTLAAELSAGKVDIPSFPEVAVRVRRVLADPKSSVEQVMRVVGSEPALAARLLRISNSASLNRSGRVVADLRTAINRIGYNMVRSASISFAMTQIRNANKLAGLEHYLNELWERSTLVAAFAYVLARSCSRVNPDEALLGGMMHGIGELYVLTRAAEHPELFVNGTSLNTIINDWHASIGKAILENWEFSDEMAAAVGDQHDLDRADASGEPDLSDVIAVALVLASHSTEPDALGELLQELPAVQRLGLDEAKTDIVIRGCAEEVAALSSALAG